MEMTEIEINALLDKKRYPHKKVICPRCGKALEVEIFKTAARVKCPTAGCLQYTMRGI